LEPGFDLCLGALSPDQPQIRVQPVAAGSTSLGSQDLNLVSCFQFLIQGTEFSVNARTATAMPNVCVDVIGKVDGGGTGRKVNDVAARGEDVDPVLEHIRFHTLDEFMRVAYIRAPFHHVAEIVDA